MKSNSTIPAFINNDIKLINAIRNYHLSIQTPIINKSKLGLSLGCFFQKDARMWRDFTPSCEMCFGGTTVYGIVSLSSYGIKSTILFRNNIDSNYSFSGFSRIGRIIELDEYNLSFGITFTPIIRNY